MTPKPDLETMQQVEILLREELTQLGVDLASLEPHEIAKNMHCGILPDGSLVYSWQGQLLVMVQPDTDEDNTIVWQTFTKTSPDQ